MRQEEGGGLPGKTSLLPRASSRAVWLTARGGGRAEQQQQQHHDNNHNDTRGGWAKGPAGQGGRGRGQAGGRALASSAEQDDVAASSWLEARKWRPGQTGRQAGRQRSRRRALVVCVTHHHHAKAGWVGERAWPSPPLLAAPTPPPPILILQASRGSAGTTNR